MTTFATPVIWTPSLEEEEVSDQLSMMIDRAIATCAWIDGEMSTSDFLDLLDYQGIDVYDAVAGWDAGLIYL